MSAARANGLTIEYESLGPRDAPAILLVMGLGMQMHAWPDPFCQALVERGWRVVRFDNRDSGLSSKMRGGRRVHLPLAFATAWLGLPVPAPYSLDDMAADAVGLLDALDIGQAHVVGASMGGMIAQLMAAHHPARVRTLVSIMSSSGNRRVSRGSPAAARALMSRPRDPHDADSVIEHLMSVHSVIGSPGFPTDRAELRARIAQSVRRNYDPGGVVRQLLAILHSGDRRPLLARIQAPTLVIHGKADPLVPVEAGRDTAASIPGAQLLLIDGMGHDLAPGVQRLLLPAIDAHCRRHEPQLA